MADLLRIQHFAHNLLKLSEGHVPKLVVEGISKLQSDIGITPPTLVLKVAGTSGEQVRFEKYSKGDGKEKQTSY